jgi:phage tail P2-like protein
VSYDQCPIGCEPIGTLPRFIPDAPYDLTPPNATWLEEAMARVIADITNIHIPIAEMKDPMRCPVDLLPFLAWEFNVDDWDSDWPTSLKRTVIASAIETHRYKGTRRAVLTALESVGVKAQIIEWHEQTPEGPAGTFKIQINTADNIADGSEPAITLERINRLDQLVNRVKRLSRHHTIELFSRYEGKMQFASAITAFQTHQAREVLV